MQSTESEIRLTQVNAQYQIDFYPIRWTSGEEIQRTKYQAQLLMVTKYLWNDIYEFDKN